MATYPVRLPMVRLAVNMIVRDGLSRGSDVVRALESLCALPVHQYVVVDTGSRDGTQEALRLWARQNNARLHLHEIEWEDDFAAARNAALKRTVGTHMVWIDADDECPIETAHSIADFCRRKEVHTRDQDGVEHHTPISQVGLLTWLMGPRITHSALRLRVVPLLDAVSWRYPLHENIEESAREAGAIAVDVNLWWYHHGYGSDEHLIDITERNDRIIRAAHMRGKTIGVSATVSLANKVPRPWEMQSGP